MTSILMSDSVGTAVEEVVGVEEEEEVRVRFSGVMRAPPPRLTTSPVLFTRIRSSFTALTLGNKQNGIQSALRKQKRIQSTLSKQNRIQSTLSKYNKIQITLSN